jgi:hypothetical protein
MQPKRGIKTSLFSGSCLYWHIGKRIREEVLQEKRAEYGQAIIAALSRRLTEGYGRGYT